MAGALARECTTSRYHAFSPSHALLFSVAQVVFGDPYTGNQTACGWWARVGNNLSYLVHWDQSMVCPPSMAADPSMHVLENYWPNTPPTPQPPNPSSFNFAGLSGSAAVGVLVVIIIASIAVVVASAYFGFTFCSSKMKLASGFAMVPVEDHSINNAGVSSDAAPSADESLDVVIDATVIAAARDGAYSPLPGRPSRLSRA